MDTTTLWLRTTYPVTHVPRRGRTARQDCVFEIVPVEVPVASDMQVAAVHPSPPERLVSPGHVWNGGLYTMATGGQYAARDATIDVDRFNAEMERGGPVAAALAVRRLATLRRRSVTQKSMHEAVQRDALQAREIVVDGREEGLASARLEAERYVVCGGAVFEKSDRIPTIAVNNNGSTYLKESLVLDLKHGSPFLRHFAIQDWDKAAAYAEKLNQGLKCDRPNNFYTQNGRPESDWRWTEAGKSVAEPEAWSVIQAGLWTADRLMDDRGIPFAEAEDDMIRALLDLRATLAGSDDVVPMGKAAVAKANEILTAIHRVHGTIAGDTRPNAIRFAKLLTVILEQNPAYPEVSPGMSQEDSEAVADLAL